MKYYKVLLAILFILFGCNKFNKTKGLIMTIPRAKKTSTLSTYFNNVINDEYAWLRAKSWPETIDQNILDYLESENNYYQKIMDTHKNNEDKLFKELISRIKLSDQTLPIKHGDFYYYSYTNEDSDYPIYCRKKHLLDLKSEIIFDENIESKGNKFYVTGAFSINLDHNLLAYSVDLSGDERYRIKIRDINSKTNLNDIIENTIGDVYWNKDGFFYTALDDNWRSKKIYYHSLGTNQADDILIYEEKAESYNVNIYKSADKKYLFIETSSSVDNEVYYINIDDQHMQPKLIFKRRKNHLYYANHSHDYLYIQTNDKGKNFRLIKVKNSELGKSEPIELISHNENIYLKNFYLYKNFLVTENTEKGLTKINISDHDYKDIKNIEFSEDSYSSSVIYTDYEYDNVWFNYSSLNTPDSVIEYDAKTNQQNILKVKEIPSGFNKDLYKVERLYAPSDDVMVPISLIYRKDKFLGNNPLYLYGYGSYGIAIPANFKSTIFSLIDRGFVYAIAHIRGGDDLGYSWYENAKFLNKKRTFADFINCAKYLIEKKYTTIGNITIAGGSAGGMLVGAAINMESNLFKAAIAHVPFVDVLNTMLDETLPLTPGEYFEWGNPKDEEYYNYIRSYSPYDNITKKSYPAMYVTAGLYDPRVTYWEPAKWVAKLREYKTDDNLLLFETNMTQGHKGASSRFDYLREIAKEHNFIFKIYNMIE